MLLKALGIMWGSYLFSLIPQPNNITINATEHEARSQRCLGSVSQGVEFMTLGIVIFLFLVKKIVMYCLSSSQNQSFRSNTAGTKLDDESCV